MEASKVINNSRFVYFDSPEHSQEESILQLNANFPHRLIKNFQNNRSNVKLSRPKKIQFTLTTILELF